MCKINILYVQVCLCTVVYPGCLDHPPTPVIVIHSVKINNKDGEKAARLIKMLYILFLFSFQGGFAPHKEIRH